MRRLPLPNACLPLFRCALHGADANPPADAGVAAPPAGIPRRISR
jgi:hypothetical protein